MSAVKLIAVVLVVAILQGGCQRSQLNGDETAASTVPSFVDESLACDDKDFVKESQTSVTSSSIASKENQQNDASTSCGLWIAPSTIPGAGIGLFAGRSFAHGDVVMDDLAIAIVDLAAHNAHKFYLGRFVWDDYIWSGDYFRMNREGYSRVDVASEGTMNCFLDLVNTNVWHPRLVGTSDNDDGIGARTLFHHRKVTARGSIAAGAELFTNYGPAYFDDRPALATVPRFGDLERATRLLQSFSSLKAKLLWRCRRTEQNDIASECYKYDDLTVDLWTTFVHQTKFRQSRVLVGAFAMLLQNETNQNIKDFLSNLQTKHGNNVTLAHKDATHVNHASSSTMATDWLPNHGVCADSIVGGKASTIENAGLGAFATRPLPQGSIVAHLPMIHIADKGRLEMFALHRDELSHNNKDWVPVNDTIVGHQLLLNYCYGHAESTLLLCPYSPHHVNYVNHNQTLANVRLVWSNDETALRLGDHMPHLLDASVESIAYAGANAKLAMNLIATRDIVGGEEILLDYGDAWEEAWTTHVAKATSSSATQRQAMPRRKTATQIQYDRAVRLRTVFEELHERLYSPDVETLCDSTSVVDPITVQRHSRDGTLYAYLWEHQAAWWPCSVLRSRLDENDDTPGEYVYTVHMLFPSEATTTSQPLLPSAGVIVRNVPRDVIHFVDKPYTAATYRPDAFRHDIRIPDAIFPQAWRNTRFDVT